MAEFRREQLDNFLGVVRKYMQVRGNLTQKELAQMCAIGDSTMSRFLNQKTSELNADMIARIVAFLSIPLHEVIDFVEEPFTEEFKRYVNFHKEGRSSSNEAPKASEEVKFGRRKDDYIVAGEGQTRQNTMAHIKSPSGVSRSIPFGGEGDRINDRDGLWESFEALSSKQKLYIKDFFNLDLEGKDLIVDVGNNIIRFVRQKGFAP